MPEYSYKAKDKYGQIRYGSLVESSKKAARDRLRTSNLKPLLLKSKSGSSSGGVQIKSSLFYRDEKNRLQIRFGSGLPSKKQLVVFTKQFSILIERGVPLIQSLNALAEQQDNVVFKKIINDIKVNIENGLSLSAALERHPKVFNELYVSMVKAGETSGGLDTVFKKLAVYIEKLQKIVSQVRSALVYPSLIIVVAMAVVALLLILVVPTFAEQFKGAGRELPFLTALVINMSNELQSHFLLYAGAIFLAFVGFKKWTDTESGRKKFDRFTLNVPIIGPVMRKIVVGRFCSTMSTMLVSGVAILEALRICSRASGNKVVEEFVINTREKISKGLSFAESLKQSDIFPSMVVSMISVGESTGALDETLEKIAEIYEDEVDLAIKTMMSMIEPILIVVIGGIVGFIVVAMYLPIFDLANTIK